MITKTIATQAHHYETFHHVSMENADGSPLRARVNGKCQTWKTRPDEFRLPMKHGLRECFYITERNGQEWLTDEQLQNSICPVGETECLFRTECEPVNFCVVK